MLARLRMRSPGIRARLAIRRHDIEFPRLLSITQAEGADPPAAGPFRSSGSDVDQVSMHQRRHTNKVAVFGIRDLFCPQETPCFGVQRYQIIVPGAANNLSIDKSGATVGMHEVAIARLPFIGPTNVAV